MARLFDPLELHQLVDCCAARPLEAVAEDYRRAVRLTHDERRALRTAICKLWMHYGRQPVLADVDPRGRRGLEQNGALLSFLQKEAVTALYLWAIEQQRRQAAKGGV